MKYFAFALVRAIEQVLPLVCDECCARESCMTLTIRSHVVTLRRFGGISKLLDQANGCGNDQFC